MTDDVLELDDVAARALASIILEHTALMLSAEPDAIVNAVQGLADDAAIVLDVAAAILTATSWLVGAGEVAPEAIFAASVAFDPAPAMPGDDEGHPPPPSSVAPSGVATPPEGATSPQNGTEAPIRGDGGQADPDFAAMAAEAMEAAQAALDAPGGDDAPEG